MKNVNLTGLFLALSAKFGVNAFELSSIAPEGKEPNDVLIKFKGGNFGYIDLEAAAEKCETVEVLVNENITGEVSKISTSIKSGDLELYIEFLTSDASHWDN
jgi:hypothetical protein